jgi:transposase
MSQLSPADQGAEQSAPEGATETAPAAEAGVNGLDPAEAAPIGPPDPRAFSSDLLKCPEPNQLLPITASALSALAPGPERNLVPVGSTPHDSERPCAPSRPPRRAAPLVALSAEEKAQLERIDRQHTAPCRLVQRARIILLAAQGQSVSKIAATLRVCTNTVRKWVGRYADQSEQPPETSTGADAPLATPVPEPAEPPPSKLPRLADAPRPGRPDTFTGEEFCRIIALACERPEDHGRPITHWTASELKDEVQRDGIVASISARHIGRLLNGVDLQPHRSRYWLNAKPDPNKEGIIRAVCALYQQAQEAARRGELTFSVDEMTGLQALARIKPDHPMQPGQPVRREFEYERHGTLSLLAGLAVAEGKVQALCRPTRTEADFLEFIDAVVQAHPQAQRFNFVLDNLNTHQSESLVRYVARDAAIEPSLLGVKGQEGILQNLQTRAAFLSDATHRIRFCYTPKHASWINQIEIWFGILVRKVIRRGDFASLADLEQKLLAFIDYFNRTMAKPFKWTYQGKPLQGLTSG